MIDNIKILLNTEYSNNNNNTVMSAMFWSLLNAATSCLRSLSKRVIRFWTGMSEIERICHSAIIFSSKRTKLFSSALKRSKKILTYRKLIFSNVGSFKPFSVSAALENILQIKGIKAENNSLRGQDEVIRQKVATIANITTSLHAIRVVNLVAAKLEAMRKETFDRSNKHHISLLNKLWTALKPDCQRKSEFESGPSPEVSADWGEIGFQGKDPATDFRGMGLLGLRQLACFCEKHPDTARSILLISNHPQKYFPFAITGINITAFVLEMLNEFRLHEVVFETLEKLVVQNPSKYSESKAFDDAETLAFVYDEFDYLYCFIFQEFCKSWITENPKDIMDFPRIFKDVKQDFRSIYPSL